ncbi:hypothetical protein IWQ61_003510 [Dispira simplex]|nr:hypothetical protein IWQ61_003510 [Dispira simplex]
MAASKRRVAYYYDNEVGNYTFGPNHVMKPQRMRMVHNLVVNYDLHKKMEVIRPTRATFQQMTRFHTDEYINYLRRVTSENAKDLVPHQYRFLAGDDCPVWEGIYEFCSISAGGSIAAANKLNHGEADIAINWSGGLHHAKKSEASGFCYVNDIVLGILELLRYHQRVVYIDIDVHHGDGVEEAFYTSDRVMSVSFHKYGDFFPGTGDLKDIGIGKGRRYAVNVPLRDGIDDKSYRYIFQSVMQSVMDHYRPEAIMMQCGTDSLSGDRLGCFNLSMKGHAECVKFMRSFNVPMVVVGGGGYTIRNVARTWTYETTVLLDTKVSETLPYHDYYEFYGPDYRLHVPSNNMDNYNDRQFLSKIHSCIVDNLRQIPHAPSVQLQEVPRDYITDEDGDEEEQEDAMNADIRISQRQRDLRIVPENEFSDGEDRDEDDIGEGYRESQSYRYDTTYGYQPPVAVATKPTPRGPTNQVYPAGTTLPSDYVADSYSTHPRYGTEMPSYAVNYSHRPGSPGTRGDLSSAADYAKRGGPPGPVYYDPNNVPTATAIPPGALSTDYPSSSVTLGSGEYAEVNGNSGSAGRSTDASYYGQPSHPVGYTPSFPSRNVPPYRNAPTSQPSLLPNAASDPYSIRYPPASSTVQPPTAYDYQPPYTGSGSRDTHPARRD